MAQKTIKELNAEFVKACQSGDLKQVEYLLTSPELKEHADIHAWDDYGLRCACWNGHLDIVKYLLTSPDLKEHADVHAEDDIGFQWACLNGHTKIVEYLLSSSDVYTLDRIKTMDFKSKSEISREEAMNMAKARDLKNQLMGEVFFNNKITKTKPWHI